MSGVGRPSAEMQRWFREAMAEAVGAEWFAEMDRINAEMDAMVASMTNEEYADWIMGEEA